MFTAAAAAAAAAAALALTSTVTSCSSCTGRSVRQGVHPLVAHILSACCHWLTSVQCLWINVQL